MKKDLRFISVFAAVSFAAAAAFAAEFSADMVNTSKAATISQKFFVNGNKSRMESPESIVIIRMDKNVMWMLMSQQKMYMEQPLDPSKIPATSEKYPGEMERTLVGKEAIDGRTTEKYRITYTVNGMKVTVYQWLAPDLGMPVKTAAEDGSWTMEYKNIETGSQPDSLFEIPSGYSKFTMPSAGDMMN